MGRDEHRKSKNSFMAQTPANQKSDGVDVEFAQEAADHADLEAQERARQADKRAKRK
ncbi:MULTISPECIES: YfhD family protein [Virgibacillus]|uniref:YfhD family protein n=1 Tax=Virgibacillus TaxID=84406 RepID=UPI00090A815A|nr:MULTISPECIES: YfhD family protein [Virgibacillus]API92838.1 YfhD family protein [Virgibacillus sp. 6R]MBS7428348.1 YfhD family protein [Virgibacillus sp. 19R1-5]MBU8565218.1 YfhD family protein [Virgibacillus pantothenticus]MBU8601502.1 YfhD family protein [Virgibacillus pantothenticus]MBU8633537.1 YfhD family protein [Virgibacillus pantothenticus]